jgi:predicted nucleotidyltransferase
MFAHEKKALERAVKRVREKLSDRIISIYAFGSRVRGDYEEWSDFDVIVVVKSKTPQLEAEIISIFVNEELRSGIPFSPVIKDIKTFEMEKRFNTPFYRNIIKEGVLL